MKFIEIENQYYILAASALSDQRVIVIKEGESFGLFESIIVLAMVVLGGMGNIPGVILGAVLLTLLPEVLRYTMEPLQNAIFGRVILDAETIRLLVFGVALVAIMLYRPAGLWPSAVRKRELEVKGGAA